jgi:hypothetical protein
MNAGDTMDRRIPTIAYLFLLGGVLAAPSFAQDEDALKKDLAAVIALHGQPCGEVVGVKVQKEKDYLASCKDGNRYRVYENEKGRVVVDKQ